MHKIFSDWANDVDRLSIIVIGALLSGCASVDLPLCPRLASLSRPEKDSTANYVNEFVSRAAQQRGVKIAVLNPFVAEFKGDWNSVNWMQRNYPTLLCSFDPSLVIDPTTVHTVCTKHASTWITIIKDDRLDDLFLEEHFYKASCYPRLNGS